MLFLAGETYRVDVRRRIFAVARETLQTTMPQKMPFKVQPKVMQIRMRARAGGPPSAADRGRIQQAMMKRTRPIMMKTLHATADKLAADAANDEKLLAAGLGKGVSKEMPEDKAAAFQSALRDAGVTGDESACLEKAKAGIIAAIDAYDPDITGIVDPETGEILVKDEDL